VLNHRKIRRVFTKKLCRSSGIVSILCQILTTSEFGKEMLVGQKLPNIKFQENMATVSRVVLSRQTDMTNFNSHFSQLFCEGAYRWRGD